MGGWIKHTPGKCPVPPGAMIDVRLRSGQEGKSLPASAVYWTDVGDRTIAEYRVVSPAPSAEYRVVSPASSEAEAATALTRRDQFAMAALQGLLAAFDRLDKEEFGSSGTTCEQLAQRFAKSAYKFADAMESAWKGGA